MFKKTTFKNGLRIITVPEKNAQAATVLIMVGAGSKYETKNLSGLSHFLEHMFFKGTKKLKKPKDVAEFLDRIGGDFNAFTGEEYTGYYAKVSAEHLDTDPGLGFGYFSQLAHSFKGNRERKRGDYRGTSHV